MSEKQRGAYPAEVREWQHELLNRVLRIVFIVAIPALLIAAYYVWKDGRAYCNMTVTGQTSPIYCVRCSKLCIRVLMRLFRTLWCR